MKVELLTKWDQVWSEDFISVWQELLGSDPEAHVFLHPSMIRAWVDAYRPLQKITPRFLYLQNEAGVLFWPLVKWTRNWRNAFQRLLVPAGHSDFDYCDPLMVGDRQKLIRCALDYLSRLPGIDAISLNGFRCQYTPEFMYQEPCPFIDLEGYHAPEDFLAGLKSKMRYNIQRRRKVLEEQFGPVSCHVFSLTDWPRIREDLPMVLEMHRKRWPDAYKAPRYHELLLQYGLQAGIVHYSCLQAGGEAISWRLCFAFNHVFYSYMPTMNDAYMEYSPGKLHLLFCIEKAISLGLKRYDQMRGAELYKSEWTDQFMPIYRFSRHSAGATARIRSFCAETLKPMLTRERTGER